MPDLDSNPAIKAKPTPVKLKAAKATFEESKFTLAGTLDNDKKTGWSIGSQVGKDHAAAFEIEGDVGFDGGTVLTLTLKFEDSFAIGRPRFAISTTAQPAKLDASADHQHAAELLHRVGERLGEADAIGRGRQLIEGIFLDRLEMARRHTGARGDIVEG